VPLRSICTILAIIISFLGPAQIKNKIMPISKMVMQQWTVDDGLISNNLTSVTQTNDGFIWVTTFNGALRFDGVNFKLYDKENVDILKTNAFYSITDDKDGILLASQGSGLIKYQDGRFFTLPEFNASSIRKVIIDNKGRYWCGTNNEGLLIKENNVVQKVNHEAFDQVVILDIYEDSKGRIWLATEGNGLMIYEDGSYRQFDPSGFQDYNTVTNVLESDDRNIIIGTMSGVFVIDAEDGSISPLTGLENTYVNDLVQDGSGMFWFATESGLFRTDLKSGYFERFDVSNGLPSNQVSSIIIDHEESIWFSTKKSGLIRLNVGSVTTLGKNDGLTSTKINSVEENDGRIYIGTDDGSVFVKEGINLSEIDLSTKERQVGIRDFNFDRNAVWVASYLGLHRYENGKEEIITTNEGLSSNLIRRILKTTDNTLWLASRAGGVMKMRGNKVDEIYNTDNGLKSNFILALEENNDGNVVVGTHSGGISIIYQDSVLTYLPEVGGLVIFNIHVDDQNRYWISSSTGVFVFENESFRKLKFDTNFKMEAVFDFVPDDAGNIWLSTNNGIVRIYHEQVMEFLNGKRNSVVGTIFDSNDGMTIRECTGATRSTRLSDGTVWFPTIDGIAIVDPLNIQFNQRVPQVAITSFVVDKGLVLENNNVVEPGKLRYEFEFASTSYLASGRVRFKYQLSGLNEGWIETSERQIEYTNLPPGKYRFSVIGSNNDGIWNETGDNLDFVVQPFYYQTFLFKTFIGLLILLVFYFIFIWRVRRVQAINKELSKVNEELDRFVYSASHDIRAPLTSILGAARIAKSQASVEMKDQCLEMIETSAKKLDGFIRDIIDYSRNQRLELVLQKIDLKEELNSIIESLKYLDEDGQVNCIINTDLSHFETDVRRFRVILKNVIANAFLYKDPSKSDPFVSIDCKEDRDSLLIVISDNGLGMKKEVIKNIFDMFFRGNTDSKGSGLGLFIVKENIEKLKGTIDVSSVLHEGTTFKISIPKLEVTN
jgi:signal transduction histidine kinase/ligand-binding sensor domain-containing protein